MPRLGPRAAGPCKQGNECPARVLPYPGLIWRWQRSQAGAVACDLPASPLGIWHRHNSGCPGAAAALLSGLIHILDVQAFGHCPPSGCDSARLCPQGAGAGEQLRLCCCSLGTPSASQVESQGWQEGGGVPRCPCAPRLCWGTPGAEGPEKAAARQAPSPGSLRGAEGTGQTGEEREPAGAGRLPWAEGHSQPEGLWSAHLGARVPAVPELAPGRAALFCTVRSHLPVCGAKVSPEGQPESPTTLAGSRRDRRGRGRAEPPGEGAGAAEQEGRRERRRSLQAGAAGT